ncbi:amiloride-sensitive sodium channel subunit delta [Bufo bufo]|uniref:amiloride-sensitive sodium channel subunit delta n=1 Tax=Bufo bufo TaxID=8384 RepID=UPI001ABE3BD2|nr:amiloride-sensitive sodium channel subunit delta [Bufo bufo]
MESTVAEKNEEKNEEVWFEFYESFTDLFEFFCDNTTIHGTVRLNCSRRNKMKTGFWVVLFLCAFGMMYWQFGNTFNQYWSYPTKIAILLQSKEINFPAITVCNLNPYRFDQVNEYLNQLDHLAEETLSTLYGYNASIHLHNGTEILDLNDIMNNITIKDDGIFLLDKTITLIKINTEDVIKNVTGKSEKVGFKLCDSSGIDCYYRSFWSAMDAFHEWYKFHFMNIMSEIPLVLQIPDALVRKFVLTCEFNGAKCGSNYSHFHHPTYGLCITINGNRNVSKGWTSIKAGKMYGLSLTLKTDQNDNMPILSSAAGAKVMIHNPNQFPLAEHEGFDIWPGTETSISIRQDQMNRLGAPYSDCILDGSNLDFQLMYNSSYTQQTCLQSCFQYKMIETCGCGYYFYPLLPGMEYCNYNKHPGWGHCFYRLYQKMLNHRLVCFKKCPKQCSETMYQLSAGFAKWPTSVSKGWVTGVLSNSTGYKRTSRRNDIAKLNVYFQELSLRSFVETPAIEIPNLLSTMGNLWSLWFGSSVLSVVEMAELVFDVAAMLIIVGYIKFGKKREENHNVNLYIIQPDGMSDHDGGTLTTSQVHETSDHLDGKIDSKPA